MGLRGQSVAPQTNHSGEPMDVQLNFINNSNDTFHSEVVICQQNVATNFDELAVAWKVIKYTGPGDNHPFTFPVTVSVGASDSWGNYTPQLQAQRGQLFQMALTTSGDRLVPFGSGTSPTEIQVINSLTKGAIKVGIYRGGRLLATKSSVAPQQKARFEFEPTLWIGVASQIVEGQVMNSAIISLLNTELSLTGVASADIVMTGGGSGPNAAPFAFNLDNVVMA